jgi:hypothetical protein
VRSLHLTTGTKLEHFHADRTPWDVERLAEKGKGTVFLSSKALASELERLQKWFPPVEFGCIDDPATFVDMHGRIMAWGLPEILSAGRVVRLLSVYPNVRELIFDCMKG